MILMKKILKNIFCPVKDKLRQRWDGPSRPSQRVRVCVCVREGNTTPAAAAIGVSKATGHRQHEFENKMKWRQ